VSADGKLIILKSKSPGELIYILDNIAKLDTKFSDMQKAFWIVIIFK
jgi:hypothetical protein